MVDDLEVLVVLVSPDLMPEKCVCIGRCYGSFDFVLSSLRRHNIYQDKGPLKVKFKE